MDASIQINEADVRMMLRYLGELVQLPPDRGVRERRLRRNAADLDRQIAPLFLEEAGRILDMLVEGPRVPMDESLLASSQSGFTTLPGEVVHLSPRQRQVLHLLLVGEAPKRIAYGLSLSVHTVNEHIGEVYRRFDVGGRAELMVKCGRVDPLG